MTISDLPRTDESMQAALAQLAQARHTGDQPAAGQALLQLAFLVKWVRSDNDQAPFDRSHTLALEALEIFRQLGDPRGECDALLLAAPFEQEDAETMLLRAQSLAIQCGDELMRARVLAARGRRLALYDRPQSKIFIAQALALYRQLGNTRGIASCLLSTSLHNEDLTERRTQLLESSRLFRQAGDLHGSSMAFHLALMNVEDPTEMAALEPEILLALQDAQSTGSTVLQDRYNGYLAQIAAARSDRQNAAKQ